MESEARRTGRAHEHELCPESARSAWQHRPAEHSRRAVSTCSRADYEKSDKQCHDAFVLQNLLAELVSPIVRQALRLPCGNRSGCPTNEKIGALTQPPYYVRYSQRVENHLTWLTQLYVCWRRIMSSYFSP